MPLWNWWLAEYFFWSVFQKKNKRNEIGRYCNSWLYLGMWFCQSTYTQGNLLRYVQHHRKRRVHGRVHVYSANVWYVWASVSVWGSEPITKRMSFFLSLFDFVTTSIASAWGGLWAGLLCNVKFVLRQGEFRDEWASRPLQMNLWKWLFNIVASLICQLCLFEQTLPCRATQSLESADSTGEIKIFSLCEWDSSLTLILWVTYIIKLPSRAGCLSDSFVWSVVLYGFVCAVFFAFSEVKTAHFWAMFLYQVVSPSVLLQCNHGVLHYF